MSFAPCRRALALALCLGTTAGCYPRYALVQPELTLAVRDANGRPVENAVVYFVSASEPHRMLHHRSVLATDAAGIAALAGERQWQIDVPVIPDGVPSRYFAWCVEKEGLGRARGSMSAAESGGSQEPLTLAADDGGLDCRVDYESYREWGYPVPTPSSEARAQD